MLISKMGKRLMAFVIAISFVLSGLTYLPKTANAEEAVPTVKVLGATLRLSKDGVDNNGKQSMRIGIQITHASQVKDCAIELKAAGSAKSRIIGTTNYPQADKINNLLNNKVEESDTVVYSVVITDIPAEAFDTKISIWGYAITGDGTKVSSSVPESPVDRTVNGVIDSLKEEYQSMGIELIKGNLVTKYAEMTVEENGLKKKDEMINWGPTFQYWNKDDGSDASYKVNDVDGTKYYSLTTDSKSGKGIGFQRFTETDNFIACAEIKLTEPTDDVSIDLLGYWGNFSSGSASIQKLSSEWRKYEFMVNKPGDFGEVSITTGAPGQKYDIKSFVIYKCLTSKDFSGYSDTIKPDMMPGYTYELITNGDFSEDKTGWKSNYSDNSISIVEEGNNKYIKASGRWNQWSGIVQTISSTFEEGDTITVSCNIRTEEANQRCKIYLIYGQDDESSSDANITVSEWNKVEKTFAVKHNASSIDLRIEAEPYDGGSGNAEYCLDDVSFKITKKSDA